MFSKIHKPTTTDTAESRLLPTEAYACLAIREIFQLVEVSFNRGQENVIAVGVAQPAARLAWGSSLSEDP